MNQGTAEERRIRTQAIVEGALLADIAVVFLLMRAFLPVPGLRQLLRAVAAVPFVMLTQRRGAKLAILAALAAFILFSALVGPLLALAAMDVAVAGILAGMGRTWGLNAGLNLLWSSLMYTLLDLVVPTIASIVIFRYPVKTLIDAAKNFVKTVFNFSLYIAHALHASPGTVHGLNNAKSWSTAHWLIPWVGSLFVYGLLTMYLAIIISEAVLRQIPGQTLARRQAA